MDLKLSNHVFNALKQHAYSEERRSARLHEKKEHSTAVSNLFFFSPMGRFILENFIFEERKNKTSNLIFFFSVRLTFQIKDVNKTQVALLIWLFRFNVMVINYLFKTNILVVVI